MEAFVICFMKWRFNSAIITHFEAKCLGTIHIWHPLKFSNFQNPHLPVHLRPKFFHPLDLGCPISNNSTPPFHPQPLQQTMEQQPHRARERTKSKPKQNQVRSHSNWPRIILSDLAHRQCNGIIKVWIHSLTLQSIERVLVNNKLMFDSAWCLKN